MIELTLTDEQAKIVGIACEFYARVKMGQFNEIIWHTIDFRQDGEKLCKNRDEAQRLLFEARKYLMPGLGGIGHSYGMGDNEYADKAYDVYQVIRNALGDDRTPFSYYELPKIKKY